MSTSFILDVRLALRMLVKYPLLTIVGSIGIAFGIGAGVGGFEMRSQFVNPTLPLEEGQRIVGVRNWDTHADRAGLTGEVEFTSWLEQLDRVDDLSAVALVERNLAVNGTVEPIAVAEMTASGFHVARVPALLGRTLVEGDETPGAPPVAVIGYDLWQRRFLGDAGVIGRSVRLGVEQATIVGVMPETFGFPVSHQVWMPLRFGRSERAGPALMVFGRLAPGWTLDEAQAELTTVGRRMAADAPGTHAFLRPEVVPYAHLVFDPSRNVDIALGMALGNIFLIALVIVVSGNVALLMFARAVSREREIGVRYALGASRVRLVTQLFAEGLALSGVSAILGLAVARSALGFLLRMREADAGTALPFWVTDSLAPSTVAYGVALALVVALIIGVFPALKVTGRGLEARLRSYSPGGGGYRFGGVWTAVIAVQVAVTVMFPAWAFFFHRWVVHGETRDVGFPAKEYLSARLVMDAGNGTRTAAIVDELRRQLNDEPGVSSITMADTLPGMFHGGVRVEVEDDDAPATYGHAVRVASVDTEFFGALGAPVLSGRGFAPSDLASGRDVAIVNVSFVARVLRGQNPVGRRVRAVAREGGQAPGPWVDIVGVVRDLGMSGADGAGLYRPLVPDYSSVRMALHVAGGPTAVGNRLRALASRVDPGLRVHEVMPLDQVGADQSMESRYLSRMLAVLSGIALLLSLIAIYAVMSFTVVQRTTEIGTRVALGADRWQIVATVVRRPLVQIGLGIGIGAVFVALIFLALFDSAPTALEAGLIAVYATAMLGVCLSACLGPVHRALRLQPSQVLRADAT